MAKLYSALPCEITSPFTREIISVLHSKACNNLYIFHSYSCKLRASEARETPSIATNQKKCLGVSTSKPQCACSQFYVKRRSGRVCIHEKPACCSRVQLRNARFTYIKMTQRRHIKHVGGNSCTKHACSKSVLGVKIYL